MNQFTATQMPSIQIDTSPKNREGSVSLSRLAISDSDAGRSIHLMGRKRTLIIHRICPGMHLGSASVWMAIATMLAALEFSKAKDSNGNEITPDPKWTTGITA